MRSLIDWLQFTLPRPSELSSELMDEQLFYVFDLLRIPQTEFMVCKTGMNGYRKRLRFGNITVLYDGSPEMGIHVIFTGSGCRTYENYMLMKIQQGECEEEDVWGSLINRIMEYSDKFTRVDISVDDFKTYFPLNVLAGKLWEGVCTSLFNDFKVISSGKISTGISKGMTIYLGSATSDFQIVCYDKYLERKSKGKELDDSIAAWNRFECRFYDNHAVQAAKKIAAGEHLGKLVHGTIHKYFNVLQPKKGDSNRSRWPLWNKWARFLGDVEKAKFEFIKPEKTIEDTLNFAKSKLPKVFAKVHAVGGNEMINEIVADGILKFTDMDIYGLEEHMQLRTVHNQNLEIDEDDDQIRTEFKRRLEVNRDKKKNQPDERID